MRIKNVSILLLPVLVASGGLYLHSIIQEQDEIITELNATLLQREEEIARITGLYEKERIQIRYEGLKDFDSQSDLEEWLLLDDTNNQEYIPTENDCEDFAMRLVKNAAKAGYKIFPCVEVKYINPYFHLLGANMICAAIVGEAGKSRIFYIEPTTDEIHAGPWMD